MLFTQLKPTLILPLWHLFSHILFIFLPTFTVQHSPYSLIFFSHFVFIWHISDTYFLGGKCIYWPKINVVVFFLHEVKCKLDTCKGHYSLFWISLSILVFPESHNHNLKSSALSSDKYHPSQIPGSRKIQLTKVRQHIMPYLFSFVLNIRRWISS